MYFVLFASAVAAAACERSDGARAHTAHCERDAVEEVSARLVAGVCACVCVCMYVCVCVCVCV